VKSGLWHGVLPGLTVFVGRTQRVLVSIPRIRNLVSTGGRLAD
jgi:hypothetical protein